MTSPSPLKRAGRPRYKGHPPSFFRFLLPSHNIFHLICWALHNTLPSLEFYLPSKNTSTFHNLYRSIHCCLHSILPPRSLLLLFPSITSHLSLLPIGPSSYHSHLIDRRFHYSVTFKALSRTSADNYAQLLDTSAIARYLLLWHNFVSQEPMLGTTYLRARRMITTFGIRKLSIWCIIRR